MNPIRPPTNNVNQKTRRFNYYAYSTIRLPFVYLT